MLGDDAVGKTFVELGSTVYGNCAAADCAYGVYEFDAGGLHLMDSSKGKPGFA
jgi:hypothetical protein